MKTSPQWLNRSLFPFESKWITIEGNQHHYIDVGTDETLLFVHGTPEWIFGYRDIILELSKHFRCVAMDHLGFGLSDKPSNADYTISKQATRLACFIDNIVKTPFTLIGNDFGGGMALSYAIANPSKIKSIVLFNTWCWSLSDDPHYSKPARMINTWLGRFLYLRLNFSVNVLLPKAFGNKSILTKDVHRHYKEVFPDSESRISLYTYAQQLMGASVWWESLWNDIHRIENIPTLIFWGMKDPLITSGDLARWESRLPKARIVRFDDAGHFVQEEKPSDMASHMREWLSKNG